MQKIMNQTVNNKINRKERFTIIEENSTFDEVMEKVTNGMFNVILLGGIPYFLWIFTRFIF